MRVGEHEPVSVLPDGWFGCDRCGAAWDPADDEARGRSLLCEPEPEPTVYRAPHSVPCRLCGAPVGEPCRNLATGEALHGWHVSRDGVPA